MYNCIRYYVLMLRCATNLSIKYRREKEWKYIQLGDCFVLYFDLSVAVIKMQSLLDSV